MAIDLNVLLLALAWICFVLYVIAEVRRHRIHSEWSILVSSERNVISEEQAMLIMDNGVQPSLF